MRMAAQFVQRLEAGSVGALEQLRNLNLSEVVVALYGSVFESRLEPSVRMNVSPSPLPNTSLGRRGFLHSSALVEWLLSRTDWSWAAPWELGVGNAKRRKTQLMMPSHTTMAPYGANEEGCQYLIQPALEPGGKQFVTAAIRTSISCYSKHDAHANLAFRSWNNGTTAQSC